MEADIGRTYAILQAVDGKAKKVSNKEMGETNGHVTKKDLTGIEERIEARLDATFDRIANCSQPGSEVCARTFSHRKSVWANASTPSIRG